MSFWVAFPWGPPDGRLEKTIRRFVGARAKATAHATRGHDRRAHLFIETASLSCRLRSVLLEAAIGRQVFARSIDAATVGFEFLLLERNTFLFPPMHMTSHLQSATKGDIERLHKDLQKLQTLLDRRLFEEREAMIGSVMTYFDRSVDAILDELSPSLHCIEVELDQVRQDHDRRLKRLEKGVK